MTATAKEISVDAALAALHQTWTNNGFSQVYRAQYSFYSRLVPALAHHGSPQGSDQVQVQPLHQWHN